MSINIQYLDWDTVLYVNRDTSRYVDRHTCSILNQVTSLFLVWCNFTDRIASRCNYWQKGEKKPVFWYLFQNGRSLRFNKRSIYKVRLFHVIVCCRGKPCMLIDIQYLDWHTVSRSTNVRMSIEILYVNRDIVCRSRFCMSTGCYTWLCILTSYTYFKKSSSISGLSVSRL